MGKSATPSSLLEEARAYERALGGAGGRGRHDGVHSC
jgi:hypothetical protein